jgi:hypothetical protein
MTVVVMRAATLKPAEPAQVVAPSLDVAVIAML